VAHLTLTEFSAGRFAPRRSDAPSVSDGDPPLDSEGSSPFSAS
jgi:hypothetical protein